MSEIEFYQRLYDLLLEAQQEVSEVIQHLEYMQSKLSSINTNLSIKLLNAKVFGKDSK